MRVLILAAAIVSISGRAFALDGYQDRRGLYSAFAVGGGMAKGEGDGQAGFRLAGRAGGGLSQQLTADLTLDYQTILEPGTKVIGFDLASNFFPLEHAFLRGGAGMSLLSPEVGDNKAGFGLIAGVGIEAFFAADLAGSFALTYEPDIYGGPTGTVHNIWATVTLSWY